MTLIKQLFVGTSIAFLFVLGAVEGVYVLNAHKYLQEQLSSHAQDAATSLGMVLPVSLADNDMVRAEVTVNAIFDRGYYQSIRVVNTKGETLLLKTLPAAPAGVPEWFVNLLPMELPAAESFISKGWRQMGRVVVSSHPNFAYQQLWHTSLEAALVLAMLYLLSLAVLHGFLSRILRPLREIEDVAHAISERDFKLVKTVAGARELRSVVKAINSMSTKLQAIIEHEVRQANHFRDESSKDALTGLDNRRGFEQQIQSILEDAANWDSGVMYLLQITNFQRFNASNGFREGDALLKTVASALSATWAERNLLRSRINGATFVVVMFNVSRDDAVRLGDELCSGLTNAIEVNHGKYSISFGCDGKYVLSFGCGGAYFFSQKVTLKALLAQCDLAMLQSQTSGKSVSVLMNLSDDEGEGEEKKGSQFWKKFIVDALQAERLALLVQPVMSANGERQLQVEVMGRLKNAEGELVSAKQFIPMANRHHLTPALDLAVFKRLFGRMASGMIADDEVAINLSIHSIHDSVLLAWLTAALRDNPAVSRRLVFEFTEFGVVQDGVGVEQFVAEIRKLGAEFAVDNFGLHHSAFEYLQRLKPRYVKLSPAYIRELRGNRKNQLFISSVVKITRSLEVRVIALGVEEVDMLPLLKELGVDGYQGYVTGEMNCRDL